MLKKFNYPDIPPIADRRIYDYYFQVDRLLREFGGILTSLDTSITALTSGTGIDTSSSSNFTIPFSADDDAPYITVNTSSGKSDAVAPICWSHNPGMLSLTGDNTSAYFVGTQFTIPNSTDNVRVQFITSAPIKIKNIVFQAENWASFTTNTGNIYYPYVIIATAPLGSKTFTLQLNTLTTTTNPTFTGSTPTGTTCSGTNVGIDYVIPEQTQVMVCVGWYAQGPSSFNVGAQYIYFNGSVLCQQL